MDTKDIEKIIKEGKAVDKIGKKSKEPFLYEGSEIKPAKNPNQKRKTPGMIIDGDTYEVIYPKPKDKFQPLKKGGYVKAADGCAKKGRTKGRMV